MIEQKINKKQTLRKFQEYVQKVSDEPQNTISSKIEKNFYLIF